MVIWETIGLWHYPIPGFFLLAQFGLGGLVALVNLANNSVFQYLYDEGGQLSNTDNIVEGNCGNATFAFDSHCTYPLACFCCFL